MMHSAYNLNKQGDNKQPCHTPFSVWNQSIVPCMVLTVASWPAYGFLSREVRRSCIPISLRWCYWSAQCVSKSGKPSSGHKAGKGQSSSQFPRRAVWINVQITRQLHSSPKLGSLCLKILHARLQYYMNGELPDVQAEFRKGRGTRDQIANIGLTIEKAREFQKNIYLSFIKHYRTGSKADA